MDMDCDTWIWILGQLRSCGESLTRWREEYGDQYDLSLLDRKGLPSSPPPSVNIPTHVHPPSLSHTLHASLALSLPLLLSLPSPLNIHTNTHNYPRLSLSLIVSVALALALALAEYLSGGLACNLAQQYLYLAGGLAWHLAQQLVRPRNLLQRGRWSARQAMGHRYFWPEL